jgi:hypothetical protein
MYYLAQSLIMYSSLSKIIEGLKKILNIIFWVVSFCWINDFWKPFPILASSHGAFGVLPTKSSPAIQSEPSVNPRILLSPLSLVLVPHTVEPMDFRYSDCLK